MLLFSAVCSAHCSRCTQTFYLDTGGSHDKVHCKSNQSLAFGYIELFWQSIFWIYSAFYPLGTLWSDFTEHWKCAQLFAHWVHWSQMAGHIQNVLSIYPLGISGSHNRVYSKCTQHLITGHIGVTCWLRSQYFHHVPSGYLGPCPQCNLGLTSRIAGSSRGPAVQWECHHEKLERVIKYKMQDPKDNKRGQSWERAKQKNWERGTSMQRDETKWMRDSK